MELSPGDVLKLKQYLTEAYKTLKALGDEMESEDAELRKRVRLQSARTEVLRARTLLECIERRGEP